LTSDASTYGYGTQAHGCCLEAQVLSGVTDLNMDISYAPVSILTSCPFIHTGEDKGDGSLLHTALPQSGAGQSGTLIAIKCPTRNMLADTYSDLALEYG